MITVEEISRRAKKYNNRKEFCKHDSWSYHIASINGVLDEVCAHMKNKNTRWNREKLKELASKYEMLKDFIIHEHRAYNAILYHGWEDILSDLKRTYNWTYKSRKDE